MKEPTTSDVVAILKRKPNSLTARRWLKDPVALQVLLDNHLEWNADHIKFNEPEMVFPLETNVLYAVDVPELIEKTIAEKKEQPE